MPRGRKGKKAKAERAKPSTLEQDISELDFDPDHVLRDSGYKKHLQRHSNKVLLRVRLLYYLRQEIIGDEMSKVFANVSHMWVRIFFSHSSLSALATASLSLISTGPKLILTYMKIVFGGKERIMKGIFVFLFESLEILWCVFIFREIDIPPPCCDGEPPNYWWDDDSDRCLLIGTFKHGEWGKGGTVMIKWWRIPTQVDWWCSL